MMEIYKYPQTHPTPRIRNETEGNLSSEHDLCRKIREIDLVTFLFYACNYMQRMFPAKLAEGFKDYPAHSKLCTAIKKNKNQRHPATLTYV
jgi:hypothetical protein